MEDEGSDPGRPFENTTMERNEKWKEHRVKLGCLCQEGAGALKAALEAENVVGPLRSDIEPLFEVPLYDSWPHGGVEPIAQKMEEMDEVIEPAQEELRENSKLSRRSAEDFYDLNLWRLSMKGAVEDSIESLDNYAERLRYLRRIRTA